MSNAGPDVDLDLRGEVCPFTFVKAKLALEDMEPGQVLRIVVDYLPAVDNVPRSLTAQGEEVVSVRPLTGADWEILVRKSP